MFDGSIQIFSSREGAIVRESYTQEGSIQGFSVRAYNFRYPLAAIVVSIVLMTVSAVARAVTVVNNDFPPTVINTVDPAVQVSVFEMLYFQNVV